MDKEASLEIGMRLRAWRKHTMRSQKEMAKMMEVSPATLRNYEEGKTLPSCEQLVIACTLGLDIHWLLGYGVKMTRDDAAVMSSHDLSKDVTPLVDAMTSLAEMDHEKFTMLVRGFTARALEARRMSVLEQNAVVGASPAATGPYERWPFGK